jgi:hypothetical protein
MWTAHGVQIDGMREFPVLSVFQVQLDGITQPHAQEWSGYRALEGPEFILHTVSQRRTFFDGFEFNDHLGRSAAGSGRRDIGGWNQFSFSTAAVTGHAKAVISWAATAATPPRVSAATTSMMLSQRRGQCRMRENIVVVSMLCPLISIAAI